MNVQEITHFIDNLSELNSETAIDLTLLADQYPYFQAAQLLRIKNLYMLSPAMATPALNFTAAYVTDRRILYYLLHPIEEKPVIAKPRSHEKEVKDTIRENISDTLQYQKELAKADTTDEIEFTASIDLRKEYGQGIELDEYVVRINNDKDTFELLSDNTGYTAGEYNVEAGEDVAVDQPVNDAEKEVVDILSLINKNVPAETLADSHSSNAEGKSKNDSLIDNFLKTNPKIVPVKPGETPVKDISEDSVKESDHLITDTLATIYLNQGNYAKAIFAYEKLSLKYPEKSAYFAAQITEIKKLIEKTK
ncbi:MAG: hypothetical protein JXB34_10400 [Bacteroidales bacterium]|nr:hypothetical protein [Bacteroidales bacterium]